jgi:hypothetical protein
MPPKARAPSFGSQDYWNQRFAKETAPFDWLSAPDALDPFIHEALQDVEDVNPQILHIGCGSSLLSQHLQSHVETPQQVHNVDYSTVVIEAEKKRELESTNKDVTACMRWDAVDLLDHASLVEACDRNAYSIVVDKSTSDAISCADDVVCPLPYPLTTRVEVAGCRQVAVEPKEIPAHPLHVMAVHLAFVTKPGARWISLSYNSERYPFLEGEPAKTEEDGTADTGIPDPRLLWTVVGKHQIEAKEQGDGNGVTHRPKVYHWLYILQRSSAPLFYHEG